uniref:Ribosomal RNA-processing protein 7 n=1 Tax=Hemiscolopendra marginata TaxID=943146 RepID=A0A646QCF5_9MYRI
MKISDGFQVLPVKLLESNSACHYIFYKQHYVRENDESKPPNKTLCLLNIPPYCQKDHLEKIFSKCGVISRIFFFKKPTTGLSVKEKWQFFKKNPPIEGFRVAYIVFKKQSSVSKALGLKITETEILSSENEDHLVGVKKWCQVYSDGIPDPQGLEKEIEKHLIEYQAEAKKIKSDKNMDSKKDDDGWITVSRRGKKPGIPFTESSMEKIMKKNKKKKSQKELLNFYTFQIKQSKMEHIAQLRKKFEEDKKKIASMRAARKFLPY